MIDVGVSGCRMAVLAIGVVVGAGSHNIETGCGLREGTDRASPGGVPIHCLWHVPFRDPSFRRRHSLLSVNAPGGCGKGRMERVLGWRRCILSPPPSRGQFAAVADEGSHQGCFQQGSCNWCWRLLLVESKGFVATTTGRTAVGAEWRGLQGGGLYTEAAGRPARFEGDSSTTQMRSGSWVATVERRVVGKACLVESGCRRGRVPRCPTPSLREGGPPPPTSHEFLSGVAGMQPAGPPTWASVRVQFRCDVGEQLLGGL